MHLDETVWPIELEVHCQDRRYRASGMSPSSLVIVGSEPLRENWLAELSLREGGSRLDVLVNVASCVETADGFEIVARPFALGGPMKTAWLALVAKARA